MADLAGDHLVEVPERTPLVHRIHQLGRDAADQGRGGGLHAVGRGGRPGLLLRGHLFLRRVVASLSEQISSPQSWDYLLRVRRRRSPDQLPLTPVTAKGDRPAQAAQASQAGCPSSCRRRDRKGNKKGARETEREKEREKERKDGQIRRMVNSQVSLVLLSTISFSKEFT